MGGKQELLDMSQLQLKWLLLQQAVPHSHCSTAPLSAAAAVGVPCSPYLLAGVCAHTVGCFIRSFIQTSCYYYSSHIALFDRTPTENFVGSLGLTGNC